MKGLSLLTGVLCGLVCGCILAVPILAFWAGLMWMFVWGDTGSRSATINAISGASFSVIGAIVLIASSFFGAMLCVRNREKIGGYLWVLLGGSIVLLAWMGGWIVQHL